MEKFVLVLDGVEVVMITGGTNKMHEDIVNDAQKKTKNQLHVLGGGFKYKNVLSSTSQQYGTHDWKTPYIEQFMISNQYVYVTTGRYGMDDVKFARSILKRDLHV